MKHDLTTKIQKKAQGRHELLKQALDTGNLNQPGLMLAVVNAVSDGSHEFADFVAERVLPAYGYCMGPWSCSLLSSVEFALDVDFDHPNYTERKPLESQRLLIERIRADYRWKKAREQAAEAEAEAWTKARDQK